MTNWVTSDLHFGHANIIKFEPETRKYPDVETMNESMIAEWNASVEPGDLVFIVGDFAFLSPDKAVAILKRLKGDKVLISGNHDTKLLASADFRNEFIRIENYMVWETNKKKIVFFHFPILEWDRCHHGTYHFYGHLHGKKSGLERFRAKDVGVDATGKVVSKIDDILAELESHPKLAHGTEGEKLEQFYGGGSVGL